MLIRAALSEAVAEIASDRACLDALKRRALSDGLGSKNFNSRGDQVNGRMDERRG